LFRSTALMYVRDRSRRALSFTISSLSRAID
jgi:hypothetical protein